MQRTRLNSKTLNNDFKALKCPWIKTVWNIHGITHKCRNYAGCKSWGPQRRLGVSVTNKQQNKCRMVKGEKVLFETIFTLMPFSCLYLMNLQTEKDTFVILCTPQWRKNKSIHQVLPLHWGILSVHYSLPLMPFALPLINFFRSHFSSKVYMYPILPISHKLMQHCLIWINNQKHKDISPLIW